MSEQTANTPKRETFSGRKAFIFAAIGSAVGLGNIWRFPYVTYDNGGGAFMIPYLVALLTAGIPLLFLDYALGHKFRGSAPLAFRRLSQKFEWFGWWQVMINVIIGLYYAVILGWSVSYTIFSFTRAWGKDHGGFFFNEYLHMSKDVGVGLDFVSGVALPTFGIWLFILCVLALGVQKGIGKSSGFFMPLLTVMFTLLVLSSLFLPGATKGLKETDLTGAGLVVGFANSSFELLAGIGVFAALGFMAQAGGKEVSDVATSGIGLAFIAFPAIIDQVPFGGLIGVLFFGSLLFAGVTSMISIIEVIIAAVQDKLHWKRVPATVVVCVPMAIVSTILFGTTTGLPVLDVLDKFVNNFGIVAVAFFSLASISICKYLPQLVEHLNHYSSFKLGKKWQFVVGILTPIVLGYMLISEVYTIVTKGYGDYPTWFVGTFGWGMAVALVIISVMLSRLPWHGRDRFKERTDE